MERRYRSVPHRRGRRAAQIICAALLVLVAAVWTGAALRGQPPVQLPAPQPGQDVVADVRVVGNSSVDMARIVPYIKTRAGRPYDSQIVLEDIRRLNRSRMFASVSTENRREPGGLVVLFRVVERPTLQYIKYIGLRNALEKNLAEETNLKVGEPVDPYAVSEGKRKIEDWYKAKGFNLIQVTIVEGTKPTDRGAIYMIHEGPQQQVSKIDFLGNTIVTGSRLRTQIQTGAVWFGYFWGYLDLAKVDEDVKVLEKYYKNLGFLTARIGRELEFDDSQTYCTLRFVVDEGPRCQINRVDFIGINKFRVEDIQGMLTLNAGQFFDGNMLLRDKSTVEQIYGSYGYVFADVRAEPRVSEDASRMDLVFVVEEGKRYRVADIRPEIAGEKPHTNIRTVLNRVELQPGDIVDVRKLRRSEARLQRSQLFAVDPARGVRPQIILQPLGEDGEDRLGSKSKNPSAPRSASGGSRPTSGVRGQSPDDWRPDDQWITLRLIGQANPQAPAAPPTEPNDERGMPPAGALPDGRIPPPIRPLPPSQPSRLAPPPSVAPRFPVGGPAPVPGTRSWMAYPADAGALPGATWRDAPPAASAFRSWGPVTSTRP